MFNFPMSPPSASTFAGEYDALFFTLCALTLFFTAIVVAAVIYFVVRYKEGSTADRSRPVYEDGRLEMAWSIIPGLIGLVIFAWGALQYIHYRKPPKEAQEIYVIGKQWMWHAMHENGVRENNTLHVPVGQPVKLTMISQDVIHAFYIPAFRAQMMVVPGRYTGMWFQATQAGEYHLFCNMYCGTQHSEMGGTVVAMQPKDYANWLANGGNSVSPMTMEQAGARIYSKVGCVSCHGNEDSLRGPSLYGIYGKKRQFSNAAAVFADEAYLRESILKPHDKLTVGYDKTMPVYQGQLSEEDLLNLLAYIKNISATSLPMKVGIVSAKDAVNRMSGNDSRNNLAVGATQYQTQDPDATPTMRKGTPAVGAIAAQGRTD